MLGQQAGHMGSTHPISAQDPVTLASALDSSAKATLLHPHLAMAVVGQTCHIPQRLQLQDCSRDSTSEVAVGWIPIVVH